MGKLSVKRIAAIRGSGTYGDGDGLYLRIGPSGAKSWILRTLVHDRRREPRLGSLAWMSVAAAREEARDDLIDRWDRDGQASPDQSRIILTHINAEVRALNKAARARMRDAGCG